MPGGVTNTYFLLHNISDIKKQSTSRIFKTAPKSSYGKRLTRKATTTNIKRWNFWRVLLSYIFIEILIVIFKKICGYIFIFSSDYNAFLTNICWSITLSWNIFQYPYSSWWNYFLETTRRWLQFQMVSFQLSKHIFLLSDRRSFTL